MDTVLSLTAFPFPAPPLQISMMGLQTLGHGARHAQLLRGQTNKTDVFGGMSVVYVGDFSQLDPPKDTPIYVETEAGNEFKDHGRHVWSCLNSGIILTETNRTNDPELKTVLTALRSGVFSDAASDLIESRCFDPGESLPVPPDATSLFYTNAAVNDVNQVAPFYAARRRGLRVCRLPIRLTAGDGTLVNDDLRTNIASYTNNVDSRGYVAVGDAKDGMLRYVDLFPGMQVTVKDGNKRVNATGLGNNSCATVVGFASANLRFVDPYQADWRRDVTLSTGEQTEAYVPPNPTDIKYILVRVESPKKFRFRGLPPNVVAIERTSLKSRKIGIGFQQFPIRPRFAMTVHQSQGQTLPNGVIVSCNWGKRLAYVAASRAKHLKDIAFLMEWNRKDAARKCRPPKSLRDALTRLQALHARTVDVIHDMDPVALGGAAGPAAGRTADHAA